MTLQGPGLELAATAGEDFVSGDAQLLPRQTVQLFGCDQTTVGERKYEPVLPPIRTGILDPIRRAFSGRTGQFVSRRNGEGGI